MQTDQRIRKKADALGLDSVHLNKKQLIQAIQIAEGNFPCFLTARIFCDQTNCCWRDECLSPHRREDALLKEVKVELEGIKAIIGNLKRANQEISLQKR